jgi:hypothetical protein
MNFEQLVSLLKQTHTELQRRAVRSVNTALVMRNWLFGWYIVEYEQKGEDRAKYGSRLLARLSKQLTQVGIKGASLTNLKLCRLFYERYTQIGQTVSDQLQLRGTGQTTQQQAKIPPKRERSGSHEKKPRMNVDAVLSTAEG